MTSEHAPGQGHLSRLVDGATLDHVGMAVRDLRDGALFYRDHLGALFVQGGENPAGGFVFAHYRFPGGGTIELLSPLGPGALADRLADRGEGFHHLTLRVDDLGERVNQLRADGLHPRGVRLEGAGWHEAFLLPAETHGVLVQLLQFDAAVDPFAHLVRFPAERDLLEQTWPY